MAAGRGRRVRREAAPAGPAGRRAAARRRGGDGHDDRGARRVEREGQERAGLAAAPRELAGRLRGGRGGVTGREELLDELRAAAFAIAYRMLASVAAAEDIAQESLMRVHRALEAGEQIESPRAYVAAVAPRLAIDEPRSARARRETYVGEWLPEPLVVDTAGDPARHAEMADSL